MLRPFLIAVLVCQVSIAFCQFEIDTAMHSVSSMFETNSEYYQNLHITQDHHKTLDEIFKYWGPNWAKGCNCLYDLNRFANQNNLNEIQQLTYVAFGLCFKSDEKSKVEHYIKVSEKIKSKSNIIEAFHNAVLAHKFYYQENYETYLNYVQIALSKVSNTKYPIIKVCLLDDVSQFYQSMGFNKESIQYAHNTIEKAKKLDDSIFLYLNYMRIADLMDEENTEEIIKYHQLAKPYGKALIGNRLEYNYHSNLANLYFLKNDFHNAFNERQIALAIAKNMNDTSFIIWTYDKIGRIYNKLNKREEERKTYDTIFQLADHNSLLWNMEYVYENRAKVEAHFGNYKNAYDALMIRMKHDEKYYNDKVVNSMLDLEKKYETLKKDAEISDTKLQIRKSNNQRNMIGLGALSIAILFFSFFSRFKNKQKIKNQEIESLRQEQQLMALDYIVQGQEDERKRIAKDLHDGLGSLLKSVQLQIKSVQTEIDKLQEINLLDKAENMIDTACSEVRRIAHNMMPDALINLSLEDALEDYIRETKQNSKLNINTFFDFESTTLSDLQKINIYRVIQELISNVKQHANANKVLLQIAQNSNELNITVEDDGIGFQKNDPEFEYGMGLKSIASRVAYLKGEINISSDNQGTSIEISIPIKAK